jgi:hypothetical protein
MKLRNIILAVAFILGFFTFENANAINTKRMVDIINNAEKYGPELKDYYGSKNYDDIKDSSLQNDIKQLCKNGCGRFTCKQSFIKQGCEKLCPDSDISNCKKA